MCDEDGNPCRSNIVGADAGPDVAVHDVASGAKLFCSVVNAPCHAVCFAGADAKTFVTASPHALSFWSQVDSAGAYALQLGPVENCSGAVCCPCVWGERVPVHDASGASELAEINRPPLTCAELCGHTNRFVVDLGGVGGEYRKLLLAAGLLWDLTHWEVQG